MGVKRQQRRQLTQVRGTGQGGKREGGGGPLNVNTQSLRKWERKANGTFLNEEQNQNEYLRKGQKLSSF